jgi:hypothetical protein
MLMSKTLTTILIVLAVLVLAGGMFMFGAMFGRHSAFGPAMAFGWAQNNEYSPSQMMGGSGPGMMRGYGANDDYRYGPGMMGGQRGYGMMDGQRGYGMMGPYGNNTANRTPLTIDQAKTAAEKYLAALKNPDLSIADVMIFNNNAYVAVKETSTGKGAFELLVDPASQIAYPEHGPNMMWNVKYGALNHQNMMGGYGGGMMGRGGMMDAYDGNSTPSAGSSAEMSVTAEQAVQYAQKYLDANITGATAANDPMQFYGYYTLDYTRNGKVAGMLSVNGFTGQAFLHTWHGTFIEEAQ